MEELKTTHTWSSFLEDARLRKRLVDKVLPAFLITKPFDENTVRAVISQALFFEMNAGMPGGRAAHA